MTYGKALRIIARRQKISPRQAQILLVKRALKRPLDELVKK
jgi:hypothetical protein